MEAEKRQRAQIFQYPRLGPKETTLYWLITIGVFAYGWYCVYVVSKDYQPPFLSRGFKDSHLPGIGPKIKDVTDFEWVKWVPMVQELLPLFCIHALLFNIGQALLCPKNELLWEFINFLFNIGAACKVFGPHGVFISILQGVLIFSTAKLTRSKWAAWFVMALMLLLITTYPFHFLPRNVDIFRTLMLITYKLLAYVSFSLETVEGRIPSQYQSFFKSLYRMIYYAFYLPYVVYVIIIYPNFERQMEERAQRPRDWPKVVKFAIRMAFWYYFTEFVLHYFYSEGICQDPNKLRAVDEGTLVSLGYGTGQMFHLKYVLMFGIPSLFAMVDNMQPYRGPICISRVSLYSKMWRNFDRGIYAFFKEYIFLPICRPTFSIGRKIFGVLLSYLFVTLWHGFTHQYIVWIIINVFELFMEQSSKALYLVPAVKNAREKYISDRNFRRILAWLQCCPITFALFSIFYFLTNSESGFVFVERIFWGDLMHLHYPFPLLVVIGYFYNNCCMDCDIREAEKKLEVPAIETERRKYDVKDSKQKKKKRI